MMRDVTSPQSYIDFGFYFLIGAALQRRVWMGNDNPQQPGQLYANHNTILVGEPGVGKGRVIIPVNDMMKFWRKDLTSGKILEPCEEHEGKYDNFLFPCGPESTTFEQLLDKMSKSLNYITWQHCINPIKNMAEAEKPPLLPNQYGHSSMYFCLEELSSLFQKDANKITDFLIQTYDCNDYRRETKTQGISQLKKPCLSFIAGTTPAFMEDTFKERLLSDGMSARCWFIYEFSNRKNLWGVKPYDNEQLKARRELILWLKNLALLYGRVEFSPDANAFLKEWWETIHPYKRPNNNMKLAPYYARKNIHVIKMSMILHFSETINTFTIPLETAQRALATLDGVEQRMHFALSFGNRNPFHQIGNKILSYMFQMKKALTKAELLEEFHSDVRDIELQEILRVMIDTGKIVFNNNRYHPRTANSYYMKKHYGVNLDKPNTDNIDLPKPMHGADLPAIPLSQELPEPQERNEFTDGSELA